ncbi:hypothetical protein D3C77_604130 [compost metagenome]
MAEAVDVGAQLAAHCADRLKCGGQGTDCGSGGVCGADVITDGIVACLGGHEPARSGNGKGGACGEFVRRASQAVAQSSELSGCIERQLLGTGGAGLECHCRAKFASSAEQLLSVEFGVL